MKKTALMLSALLVAGAVNAGSYFTALSSHYPADIVSQANAALDAIEDRIDGTTPVAGTFDTLTVKDTVTAISTNGATTNVIVTVNGELDATQVADADLGDISTSSGSYTLDNDVVAAAEMADADHGDVAWSSGVATVQSVGGAFVLTPGTIANGAGVFTQTVANASYVLEPSAVNTQTFAAATAGTIVFIKNNAATNVIIDVAAGDVTLGDNDCVTLGYLGSEWITISTKDN